MNFNQTTDSPFGPLEIRASAKGLLSIDFEPSVLTEHPNIITQSTCTQLSEYFKGTRRKFELPLDWSAHSTFFVTVWTLLRKLPFGETTTYKELAVKLGDRNKVRAVGMANAKNPIPIIVPCHRVIGTNGKLTGFAWGLEIKQKLLEMEGIGFPKQLILF